MENILLWAVLVLAAADLVLLLLRRRRGDGLEAALREELRRGREEAALAARLLREEVAGGQDKAVNTLVKTLGELGAAQQAGLEAVGIRVEKLTAGNEERLERLRLTVEKQLETLREGNEKRLEQMRQTVDEKLQGTLEKRLGESFSLVSERLEKVQQGLGEMRTLATGVGDLKKVLTNVKTRGTWGEVQLGAILEQMLSPEQYTANFQPRENSRDVVEYAVRMPGRESSGGEPVWLPIDAKFPVEDYQRLVDASQAGEADSVRKAAADLIRLVKKAAQDISGKYLNPPRTTDFAVMFLPTEGLYAEVLRQPGVGEEIQRTWRVVVAGPSSLWAILASLQVGFRSLAIEKRTSEVWDLLGAVKTEFGKFGDILDKVKKKLSEAHNTLEQTGARTRAIERRLKSVQELPAGKAEGLLELGDGFEPEEEPERGEGE